MKTTFVEFPAADGVLLQGLFFEPEKQSVHGIAHIHGLAGSFYENAFIVSMAEIYTSAGLAFLSFNNRGHDYIADLRVVGDTPGSRQGGGAFEVFAECTLDVSAALKFLGERGYRERFLQGHSTGANKVVHAIGDAEVRGAASGLVLISPCDDIGLIQKSRGSELASDVEEARQMKNAGQGDQLLRRSVFFSYPLTADTYLRDFQAGSPMDLFRYRDPGTSWGLSDRLLPPVLATFGGEGDLVQQKPAEALDMLRAQAPRCSQFTGTVIEGAGHSYTGKERELATRIRDWVQARR